MTNADVLPDAERLASDSMDNSHASTQSSDSEIGPNISLNDDATKLARGTQFLTLETLPDGHARVRASSSRLAKCAMQSG
jgi:hypothetical protein